MAEIMAWIDVPGSPTILVSGTPTAIWQYDNAPSSGDYYEDANGTVTAGIRSFTPPGGPIQETYVKCKKVQPTGKIYPDSNTNGPWSELSKNYYDTRI